jgi:hypothetical protein
MDNFKVKYYYAKDINDIDNVHKLSKLLEILQTCLFLISKELNLIIWIVLKGIIKSDIKLYFLR